VDDTITSVTLYVSMPVSLPPLTAAAAFDALVPGGRPAIQALRRARARLALGRHRTIDVEVELLRATGDRCEIGVRPCGRSVPPEGGPKRDRYFDRAIPMVSRLADAMAATVDDWLTLGLPTLGLPRLGLPT
jgi:hypothetical protein